MWRFAGSLQTRFIFYGSAYYSPAKAGHLFQLALFILNLTGYQSQFGKGSGTQRTKVSKHRIIFITTSTSTILSRPGFVVWVSRLNKYIRLYGLKFPLADHISLIKLLLSVLFIPDLEPFVINHVASCLVSLLKKRELITGITLHIAHCTLHTAHCKLHTAHCTLHTAHCTLHTPGDQLELPWRPLFQLYDTTLHSKREALGLVKIPSSLDGSLRSLIKYSRPYFPLSATREMMAEWRPLMCPLDVTMGKAMTYYEMFLPTYGVAAKHPAATYELWLAELSDFWTACGNSPMWEPNLLGLLARLAEDAPGLLDWGPHLPVVFTRIQKMFGLPVHYNKTNVGSKGLQLDSGTAARWGEEAAEVSSFRYWVHTAVTLQDS